jgi:hypothetical protein
MLRDYATAMAGSGTIEEQFRSKYMEFVICPGDDGAFRARNPNASPCTKNVIVACRGQRYFQGFVPARGLFLISLAAASERSASEPHEILADAAAKLCKKSRRTAPLETNLNARSTARLHEEVAALCAFECLMKGRYNVPWKDRFVVSRSSYRTASEIGLLARDALPVLLVSTNAFDFLYGGRILRASSLFEGFFDFFPAFS